MRIGTWNLDAKPLTARRLDLLLRAECDIWLITEVNPKSVGPDSRIAGFHAHLTADVMARGQHWAAVLSRDILTPLPDPHPASAAALIGGITFCSTILPWRGAPTEPPWVGASHADKTESAIAALLNGLPTSSLVWGGDWNHSLAGSEVAGTMGGRGHLGRAIRALDLKVPTAELMHQNDICFAIDHIAIPSDWTVQRTIRIPANDLSDHDAYTIDVRRAVPLARRASEGLDTLASASGY